MTPKLQNALIFLGIIAIAGLGYYLYTQKDGTALTNIQVDNQAAAETAEFLQRLNELKTISLEGAIFSDERFLTLSDFSQAVIPVPIGRSNPFEETN